MEVKITVHELLVTLMFAAWMAPLWFVLVDVWRWFVMVDPNYMVEWTFGRVAFSMIWWVVGLGVAAHGDDAGVI